VKKNGPYWASGHFMDDNYKYFVFEPKAPTPEEAPVVLFLHGWLAYEEKAYLEWIEHIVRKGYMVVWAQYDALLSPFSTFADHAVETWEDALAKVDSATWKLLHVGAEKSGDGGIMTAFVGHSMGGYLSAVLAARIADNPNGLPNPYTVVSLEPGGLGWLPPGDLGAMASATKMMIIVGDEDDVVCKSTAVTIWERTPQIPEGNRDFLLVQTDDWGSPAQIANHYFPNTTGFRDNGSVDARDFYVTYKLSVAAFNCAFRGVDCDYALGNGHLDQVSMGNWSDGKPLKPMLWIEDPLEDFDTTCEDPVPGPLEKKNTDRPFLPFINLLL
jgi:pimeloyl-ACP methyl ester carboxylesterase